MKQIDELMSELLSLNPGIDEPQAHHLQTADSKFRGSPSSTAWSRGSFPRY
jgi:hypothetical protein